MPAGCRAAGQEASPQGLQCLESGAGRQGGGGASRDSVASQGLRSRTRVKRATLMTPRNSWIRQALALLLTYGNQAHLWEVAALAHGCTARPGDSSEPASGIISRPSGRGLWAPRNRRSPQAVTEAEAKDWGPCKRGTLTCLLSLQGLGRAGGWRGLREGRRAGLRVGGLGAWSQLRQGEGPFLNLIGAKEGQGGQRLGSRFTLSSFFLCWPQLSLSLKVTARPHPPATQMRPPRVSPCISSPVAAGFVLWY